jgi:hypothetical protein
MWEPRRLTTIWAFTACYRDSLKPSNLKMATDIRRILNFLRVFSRKWKLSLHLPHGKVNALRPGFRVALEEKYGKKQLGSGCIYVVGERKCDAI